MNHIENAKGAEALLDLSGIPMEAEEREAFVAAYPDLTRLVSRLRSPALVPELEPVTIFRPDRQVLP